MMKARPDQVFNPAVVNQINELTDAMNNIIIPKYEATSNVINRLFNQDFATEISDCIKAINSD